MAARTEILREHSRKSTPANIQRGVWNGGLLCFLIVAFLAASLPACASIPKVARVPVSVEDILRSNEAAREADSAFARKDFYAALIKYLEASRLNPNSEYVFNKLGITYSQLQYYREATEAFRRSIGLNSKYPYSYNNLGSVYFAQNDKKNAEKHFKRAIGLNPNVASFHINLGTLYFEKKMFQRGMEEWRRGLEIDPTIMSGNDGVSLSAPGSSGSSSDRNYFMARLFASLGDADQAVENLQKALNNGFTDIEAIRKETDFDPIRQSQKFKDFMKMAALLTRS